MGKELESIKYLEEEIENLEAKLKKDTKLRDKLNALYQHRELENCYSRIFKYENKLKQLNAIKLSLTELKTIKESNPSEALEGLKTSLHNEWLRFYPQFKELNETTKIVDGCRMLKSDADNYLTIKNYILKTQSLEKEIGCPLEAVFKALKQDYVYTNVGKRGRLAIGFYGDFLALFYGKYEMLRVSNYKKTWWLKESKEE